LQVAVESGSGDVEDGGDLGDRGALATHALCLPDLGDRHLGWSSAAVAAVASRLEAGEGAVAGEVSLGQRAEDVEHQAPAGGGGVDRLGQRAEADAAFVEDADGVDEVS